MPQAGTSQGLVAVATTKKPHNIATAKKKIIANNVSLGAWSQKKGPGGPGIGRPGQLLIYCVDGRLVGSSTSKTLTAWHVPFTTDRCAQRFRSLGKKAPSSGKPGLLLEPNSEPRIAL